MRADARCGRGAGLALVLALASLAWAGTGAAGPLPGADPAFGRLFMTPAERSSLDARRAAGEEPATAAAAAPPDVVPAQVVLNGVLTRSRGPGVVWINGNATGPSGGNPRVQSGATPRVTVAEGSAHATLKPGQVWTPRTGQVRECLGCQSAAAPPPAAGTGEATPGKGEAAPASPPETAAATGPAPVRGDEAPAGEPQ